ncbi:hypothetical protein ACFSQT_02290 [Mesorhizobium calcicola]|uniref:Uncharacterized protein n=1 Tax=Mesorhizobium calcicola TaxID=1300310 RepID=A0ABW4W6F3_9HYPH
MNATTKRGVKQSGLGREGSSCGIDEHLESKALQIGGLDSAADQLPSAAE